jgi:hypothetical protein
MAACAFEAITGLALLVSPSLVTGLLLGREAPGVAQLVCRVAGIALIALAVACWPITTWAAGRGPICGLLIYNVLTALLLAEIGMAGDTVGLLLWPAVVGHVFLAIMLGVGFAGVRISPAPRETTAL